MKWFSIPLIAASGLWLLTTAAVGQDKKLKDEDISKLLVGKWLFESTDKGAIVKIELTAKNDGNYAFSKHVDINRGDVKESMFNAFSGQWKVANGKIELTHLKGEKGIPVIEINEKTLKTVTNLGEFQEWKRVKD